MSQSDQALAENIEQLMGQIRDQVEDVRHHGFGRVEVIIRGGKVTTVHAQKTWVRKGAEHHQH